MVKGSNRLTVMVTGLGGGGQGAQLLKALKLSEAQYEVIGCDMSPDCAWRSATDRFYVIPPASDSRYIDVVLKICAEHNVMAIFHGSEPELKVMNQHRDKIEAQGIFLPINPSSVLDICMDKFKTMEFLKESGYLYPKTVEVSHERDLDVISFFPAVIKPSVGGGGSANIFIAQTRDELKMFSCYLLNIYEKFIVQEYVGTVDSEYTVGVLRSMDGELLNSIAVKKRIMSGLSNRIKVPNRTSKSELGDMLAISSGVSQGDIGRYPEVVKECERMAEDLGAKGAINIQCRLVGDKVYVFEINPRFSGTTSLRALAGYNEPDVLLRKHLLNEEISPFWPYKEGTILRTLRETFL